MPKGTWWSLETIEGVIAAEGTHLEIAAYFEVGLTAVDSWRAGKFPNYYKEWRATGVLPKRGVKHGNQNWKGGVYRPDRTIPKVIASNDVAARFVNPRDMRASR